MVCILAGYAPNFILKVNSSLPTESPWEEKARATITSQYPLKSLTFTSTSIGYDRVRSRCSTLPYSHVLLTFKATTNNNYKTSGYYCYSLKSKRNIVRLKHL